MLYRAHSLLSNYRLQGCLQATGNSRLTSRHNRIPNVLSDHKKSRLSLIQLDVAGPFPKSLRGHCYFLLIIDSFTRKNWVLLLKQKSDAPSSLRAFKAAVENETSEKIRAVRSDNAAELLLAIET